MDVEILNHSDNGHVTRHQQTQANSTYEDRTYVALLASRVTIATHPREI